MEINQQQRFEFVFAVCVGGKYTHVGSLSVCSDCLAGTYASEGSAHCTNCAAGTYAAAVASPECIQCDAGKYSTANLSNTYALADQAAGTSCESYAECVCGIISQTVNAQTSCTDCLVN